MEQPPFNRPHSTYGIGLQCAAKKLTIADLISALHYLPLA